MERKSMSRDNIEVIINNDVLDVVINDEIRQTVDFCNKYIWDTWTGVDTAVRIADVKDEVDDEMARQMEIYL